MNWKIERDPYMSTVARLWGEGAVWEAGFFADDDPVDAPLDDTWWLCSPTSAVRCGLAKAPADTRPVVLLATGGFWPPHEGHVEMMERARERVRSSGRTVVGGYLSPGHDDYLQLKWGESHHRPQRASKSCVRSPLVRNGSTSTRGSR